MDDDLKNAQGWAAYVVEQVEDFGDDAVVSDAVSIAHSFFPLSMHS